MKPPSFRHSVASKLWVWLMLLFPLAGTAGVFNWPTSPAFPAGPTNGNSVSAVYQGLGAVTIANNGGGVWQAGYPVVDNTTSTGGTPGNPNGLQLFLASEPSAAASIHVSLNFGYNGGATNVSVVIWDVDQSTNFTDQIANIYGVTSTGVKVAATVTNIGAGATNTITGSGTLAATATGNAPNNNSNNNGNVTISFGATAIQSIQFDWSDPGGTTALQRTTQVIGISPITFTPAGAATPEIGAGFGSLLACGSVVAAGSWRRRRPLVA